MPNALMAYAYLLLFCSIVFTERALEGNPLAVVLEGADLTPAVMQAVAASRECADSTNQFHARMFAPSLGIAEDPATGAAVAALAGQIVAAEAPTDGRHRYFVEQGIEMRRPSLIELELVIEGTRLREASLAGHAVLIGEGRLYV